MRTAALLLIFFMLQPVLFAGTAYEAIRTAQAANGDSVLDQIVEVRGADGKPQPKVWHVVLDDPLARGGVRVLDVKGDKVVGERTPVSGYTSEGVASLIKLADLNLDSSGAFSAIEKAAVRQRVGFDEVDYSLRLAAPGGKPSWFVKLNDVNGNEVGSLQISADAGAILAEQWNPGAPSVTYANDRNYLEQGDSQKDIPAGKKVIDSLEKFGERAKRHFLRDGAAVQRFFTGESDLDKPR